TVRPSELSTPVRRTRSRRARRSVTLSPQPISPPESSHPRSSRKESPPPARCTPQEQCTRLLLTTSDDAAGHDMPGNAPVYCVAANLNALANSRRTPRERLREQLSSAHPTRGARPVRWLRAV